MTISPALDQLITAFQCLPGIGKKSAQRIVFHLLKQNIENATLLGNALLEGVQKIKPCQQCQMFTENSLCHICQASNRSSESICIVESPLDCLAIEQSGVYKGRYFILHGFLSPIDGIGPEQLGLDLLREQLLAFPYKEMIIATNLTIEGEATAHYITQMLTNIPINVTRIAQGVPLGGELEYTDTKTLSHAFNDRKKFYCD